MLRCKVTVYGVDKHCTWVVHAHSRADLYHEIAELCAAFDKVCGHQIRAITLAKILSEVD